MLVGRRGPKSGFGDFPLRWIALGAPIIGPEPGRIGALVWQVERWTAQSSVRASLGRGVTCLSRPRPNYLAWAAR